MKLGGYYTLYNRTEVIVDKNLKCIIESSDTRYHRCNTLYIQYCVGIDLQ